MFLFSVKSPATNVPAQPTPPPANTLPVPAALPAVIKDVGKAAGMGTYEELHRPCKGLTFEFFFML